MTAMDRKPAGRTRTRPSQNGGFSVNQTLTPRAPVETTKYGEAMHRMTRSLLHRAEAGDLEALTELTTLRRLVTYCLSGAAQALNGTHGYSWSEIGRAAGITKQAAAKRWGGGA